MHEKGEPSPLPWGFSALAFPSAAFFFSGFGGGPSPWAGWALFVFPFLGFRAASCKIGGQGGECQGGHSGGLQGQTLPGPSRRGWHLLQDQNALSRGTWMVLALAISRKGVGVGEGSL